MFCIWQHCLYCINHQFVLVSDYYFGGYTKCICQLWAAWGCKLFILIGWLYTFFSPSQLHIPCKPSQLRTQRGFGVWSYHMPSIFKGMILLQRNLGDHLFPIFQHAMDLGIASCSGCFPPILRNLREFLLWSNPSFEQKRYRFLMVLVVNCCTFLFLTLNQFH